MHWDLKREKYDMLQEIVKKGMLRWFGEGEGNPGKRYLTW